MWLCLPCQAPGSSGLPKASRAKEVSFSTSREAQLLQDLCEQISHTEAVIWGLCRPPSAQLHWSPAIRLSALLGNSLQMLQLNRKGPKTKSALQKQIIKCLLGGWYWLSLCICLGKLGSSALTSPDMLVILD